MGSDLVKTYRAACLVSAMTFMTSLIVATSTGAYDNVILWITGGVSIFGTVTSAIGAIYATYRENGKYLGGPRNTSRGGWRE